MRLEPGIHSGVPMAAYLADPCEPFSLSSGVAYTMFTRSALHARQEHPKLSPDYQPDDSSRAELGSAAHRMLLERTDKGIVWIPFDNYKKGAAQDMRDQARAESKTPVLAALEKHIRQMVRVADETLWENEIDLKDGDAEQTVVWAEGKPFASVFDPYGEYPIYCRIRPDWMRADRTVLMNYKTARSAEPTSFARAMASQGYDFSAAFYERGMKARGFKAQEIFLAQEITPPYGCSLVALDPALREIAERKVSDAIAFWSCAVESNKWRGYPRGIHYAEPTSWQMADDEARRMAVDQQIAYGMEG